MIHLSTTLLMPEVEETLPISVGLYYSSEFTNRGASGSPEWYFPVGAASVQLFDHASRSLFAKVISVSGRPPLGENLAIDGVIEPRIEAIEINDLGALGGGTVVLGEIDIDRATQVLARISYRFVLYDRSGASITSWDVIGDAAMFIPLQQGVDVFASQRGRDFFAVLVDAAVQDAMRQFVQGFGRNPEVTKWLSRNKSQ